MIRYGAELTHLKKVLSPEELHTYLRLFEEVRRRPKKVLKEIEKFVADHPKLPEGYNLLTYAYVHTRRLSKAEKLIRKTYTLFPDYLLGRVNFADQCLRKKKYKLVPTIFPPDKTLEELFPDKKSFHYSEKRGFYTIWGYYHLAKKEREKAKKYLEIAQNIDPNHPSVLLLELKLKKKSLYQRVLSMLHLTS